MGEVGYSWRSSSGIGDPLEKLVASAERVTETAEFLADLSKGLGTFSTAFHLALLGAQGVSMCLQASRGKKVLPVTLG